MCQTDFSRLWKTTSTNHRHLGNCVVWVSEWTLGNQ